MKVIRTKVAVRWAVGVTTGRLVFLIFHQTYPADAPSTKADGSNAGLSGEKQGCWSCR